jgi:hypothetical protein
MIKTIKENIGYQMENLEYLLERGIKSLSRWSKDKFPYLWENLEYLIREQGRKQAAKYLSEVPIWDPQYMTQSIRLNPLAFLGEVARVEKDNEIIPFAAYACQERWFEHLQNERFFALSKARQVGWSTALVAHAYLSGLLIPGQRVVVIAPSQRMADALQVKFKIMADSAQRNTIDKGISLVKAEHNFHLKYSKFQNGSFVTFLSAEAMTQDLYGLETIYLIDEADCIDELEDILIAMAKRNPLQVVMGSTPMVKEESSPGYNYSRFRRVAETFNFVLRVADRTHDLGIPGS